MFNVRSSTLRSVLGLGVLSLSLGALSVASDAATATASMGVSATVQATCLISANNLSFGTYTGTAATASTTMSVTCTNSTPYNVGLNAGTTGGATVTNRQMANGAAKLNYQITQDSGYATNWGNTVGTDTVSGTGNGNAQTLTVYGKIAGSQYVTPGSYSDTVTATINY